MVWENRKVFEDSQPPEFLALRLCLGQLLEGPGKGSCNLPMQANHVHVTQGHIGSFRHIPEPLGLKLSEELPAL